MTGDQMKIETTETENTLIVTCKECEYPFKNPSDLMKHNQNHQKSKSHIQLRQIHCRFQ